MLGREMRARALGVQVDDRDVVQLRRAIDEGLEQDRRRRRGAVQVDLVAAPDDGGRLGR